jgi:hypothetical protein
MALAPWAAPEAQHVIKRNSCSLANISEQLEVYRNRTSLTKDVTIQIVRDGCRPKDPREGSFLALTSSPSGGILRDFGRLKGHTSALTMPVGANGLLRIYFYAPRAPRVSGTFDYILTVH